MDKPSFTPGPWFVGVDPLTVLRGGDPQPLTTNGWAISIAKTKKSATIDVVEAYANARLIAAAPDLLAALRGLYDMGAPTGINLTADEMRDRYEAARAALSRATGEGA